MRFVESRTFAVQEATAPGLGQWLSEQVARIGWLPASQHQHIHSVLSRARESAQQAAAEGSVTTRVVADARTLEVHVELPEGLGLASEMLLFRRVA